MSNITENAPSKKRASTTPLKIDPEAPFADSPLNHMINTGTVEIATMITDGACSNCLDFAFPRPLIY